MSQEKPQPEDPRMSFGEHIAEIRKRILYCLYIFLVLFIASWIFREQILNALKAPLMPFLPLGSKMIFTSPSELFFTYMKLAFLAALIFGSPFIFYQLWRFISPGLYLNEKRMALPLICLACFLFLFGALFCYFVAFPVAFDFFMSMSTEDVIPQIKIADYFSLTMGFILAFGVLFETPLILVFLGKLGILTTKKMRKLRKYAILGVFIVAAIATPTPDAVSQIILAVPLYGLYELSILLIARIEKKKLAKEKDLQATD